MTEVKTKKLGKIQLKILYWLYLPTNKGGINHSPSNIIKQYVGNGVYSALKSLRKQGYIGSGYHGGFKDKIWGECYFITLYGKQTFKKNIKFKSYLEIKKILNLKRLEIFWK